MKTKETATQNTVKKLEFSIEALIKLICFHTRVLDELADKNLLDENLFDKAYDELVSIYGNPNSELENMYIDALMQNHELNCPYHEN